MTRTRNRGRARPAPQRPPTPEPAVGEVVHDRALTRRWAGTLGRLRTPRPAYLPTDTGQDPLHVDDAPVGTRVRIHDIYRVGPLNADLRLVATPEATPELWLVTAWYTLDRDQPNRTR